MQNGTEKYIETVAYLGKLYDFANERLFNGELKKPVITVQRDERNKTNGWWSVGEVWKWKDTVPANCGSCEVAMECYENPNSPKYVDCKEIVECGEHELNMTAQQLNRPIGEIAATLIHEMCHQFAGVNNMQDCSRSGTYHNKLFKKIAETHGLKVECVPQIGWSHTELTEETAAMIGNDKRVCRGKPRNGDLSVARGERSDGENVVYAQIYLPYLRAERESDKASEYHLRRLRRAHARGNLKMLLDIDPKEFEKMARAGFFENVRLRAQSVETVRERCKTLGLVPVSATVYRLGEMHRISAADIYYNVIRTASGFWLVRQKNKTEKDGNGK